MQPAENEAGAQRQPEELLHKTKVRRDDTKLLRCKSLQAAIRLLAQREPGRGQEVVAAKHSIVRTIAADAGQAGAIQDGKVEYNKAKE